MASGLATESPTAPVAAADGATEMCSICDRLVPVANAAIHALRCARATTRCQVCNAAVAKTDLEAHTRELHEELECGCGARMTAVELVVHADEECPLRTLICPFCTLAVVALEHSNHVSYCGARTEVCVECKAYIKLRDYEQHVVSGCQYPPPVSAAPDGAWPGNAEANLDAVRAATLGDFFYMRPDGQMPDNSPTTPLRASDRHGPPQRGSALDRVSEVECPLCGFVNAGFDALEAHLAAECIANGGGGPDSPYSFEVMYDHRGDGRVSAVERYPCEFCGDVFKADDLLEHQSFCDSYHAVYDRGVGYSRKKERKLGGRSPRKRKNKKKKKTNKVVAGVPPVTTPVEPDSMGPTTPTADVVAVGVEADPDQEKEDARRASANGPDPPPLDAVSSKESGAKDLDRGLVKPANLPHQPRLVAADQPHPPRHRRQRRGNDAKRGVDTRGTGRRAPPPAHRRRAKQQPGGGDGGLDGLLVTGTKVETSGTAVGATRRRVPTGPRGQRGRRRR